MKIQASAWHGAAGLTSPQQEPQDRHIDHRADYRADMSGNAELKGRCRRQTTQRQKGQKSTPGAKPTAGSRERLLVSSRLMRLFSVSAVCARACCRAPAGISSQLTTDNVSIFFARPNQRVRGGRIYEEPVFLYPIVCFSSCGS